MNLSPIKAIVGQSLPFADLENHQANFNLSQIIEQNYSFPYSISTFFPNLKVNDWLWMSSGRLINLKPPVTRCRPRHLTKDQNDEVETPLRRFRRQYEQLSQFERGRIIGMMEAGWPARTPSTDQSFRRPPHRKKCTRIANCFIDRYPGTGSIFIRDPCVFSNHTKAPGRKTFGIAAPITCAALDAHPSTPPFGVVPRSKKLDLSGMERGRL
ncbi:uncharacterized protein TNCV_238591 [Trichonephila clavipes]|nr:uncharacterized protein TNCV_238591 [Trichonephila clavipes]